MNPKFQAILSALPAKEPRSRLEPYRTLILEMRKRSRSYREIAQVLKKSCGLTVGTSTVNDFVLARSKSTAKHATLRPLTLSREKFIITAQLNASSTPCRAATKDSTFDRTRGLLLRETPTINNQAAIASLRLRAKNIRRNVLLMAKGKGEGYVGQGLGAADILAVLYFHEMRFDPRRLDWPERDRFLLSTGHYSIVLFAALTELGVFPEEELAFYGADGSPFGMSACETTRGVEITAGSLGHGLSQAIGIALGSRLSGRGFRVFNLLSDGELQEGSTWEAAMAAAHYSLDNLVALVDVNGVQADGRVSDLMKIEPIIDKWRAFGWHAENVDGNSLEELIQALDRARAVKAQPKAILCYTLMGKGVPFIEQRPKAHFVRVEQDEWDLALQQLEESRQ